MTIKTKMAIEIFAIALGVTSLLPSTGYAMKVATLDSLWGKPVKIEKEVNGAEIRYFEVIEQNMDAVYTNVDLYRVFEVKTDGKVVDKGFVYRCSISK